MLYKKKLLAPVLQRLQLIQAGKRLSGWVVEEQQRGENT